MKPNLVIEPSMPDNRALFTEEFFQRFQLRHAPKPLDLGGGVSKNYLFPTFYRDVRCAIGIFPCSYEGARALMLDKAIEPVRMPGGRSLVIFSSYEYRNVMGVKPYNEIAATIPVLVKPKANIPVLPVVAPGLFPSFGYYVFSMPVTSLENQIRGARIWGLPKVVHEIDVREERGDCVTEARDESGELYLTLRVPMKGKTKRFDVRSNLYSRLGSDLLQSTTCFASSFQVNSNLSALFKANAPADRPYLTIGKGPFASMLTAIGIEERPFQLRYTPSMTACFDLPNPGFRSGIQFAPNAPHGRPGSA